MDTISSEKQVCCFSGKPMSLSRCLDLSKTRDFLHHDKNVVFLTEADKALRIYAFLASDQKIFGGSFSLAFLNGIARKFNVRNAQLLLSWMK